MDIELIFSPPPGGPGWNNFQAAILFLEILNFDFVLKINIHFDLKITLGWNNFQADKLVSKIFDLKIKFLI